jgi:hypothetical protein
MAKADGKTARMMLKMEGMLGRSRKAVDGVVRWY